MARGAPGHALVLGPDKDVTEVALTPAHTHAPWRDLVPPQRTPARARDGWLESIVSARDRARRGGVTPAEAGPCDLDVSQRREMVGQPRRLQRGQPVASDAEWFGRHE